MRNLKGGIYTYMKKKIILTFREVRAAAVAAAVQLATSCTVCSKLRWPQLWVDGGSVAPCCGGKLDELVTAASVPNVAPFPWAMAPCREVWAWSFWKETQGNCLGWYLEAVGVRGSSSLSEAVESECEGFMGKFCFVGAMANGRLGGREERGNGLTWLWGWWCVFISGEGMECLACFSPPPTAVVSWWGGGEMDGLGVFSTLLSPSCCCLCPMMWGCTTLNLTCFSRGCL